MTRRLRLLALAVLLAASAGCSSDPSGGPMNQPSVDLDGRPALPVVMAEYERLLDDVQQQVSAVAGDRQWRTADNASGSICQDTGRTGVTASRIGVPVTNEMWPATLEAVSAALSRHGFRPPEVLTDSPTLHSIQAVDQYGATFLFNSGKALRGAVVSGCHRPS